MEMQAEAERRKRAQILESEGRKRNRWKRRRGNYSSMKEEDEKEDLISLLPDHLLHEILAFLPTRIAVCTPLLSRRWRAVWQSSPDLSLTQHSPSSVHSILRLRDPTVPLRTFSLDASSDDVFNDVSDVHSWIRYAANPALQQLKVIFNFHIFRSFRLSLSPTVFRLPNLRVLELRFSGMVPFFDWPIDAFLPSLEKLDLQKKNIGHVGLNAIPKSCPALKHWRMMLYGAIDLELDVELDVVNCPLLEDFELTIYIGKTKRLEICGPNLREVRLYQTSEHDESDYLKISAPGLRTLELVGMLPFSTTASVATVVVDPLLADSLVSSFTMWPAMLLPYFGSVHGGAVLNASLAAFRVNRLVLSQFSVTREIGKLIFDRRNQENPPEEKYENLKHLELDVYLKGFDSLGVAFWLNKFSKIETLQILFIDTKGFDYLDFQEYFQAKGGFGPGGYWDSHNFRLEKLVRVSMHGLFRCKYEYEFLEFLLRNATSLRKITISVNCEYHYTKIAINVQKVKQLRQSFPHVEILL